jgi:hypothetical protein
MVLQMASIQALPRDYMQQPTTDHTLRQKYGVNCTSASAPPRQNCTRLILHDSITNFNLVISVFSMFLMLAKTAMHMLHVFPPLLSVLVHAALVALYSVSIAYQAGSDMSDPRKPQPGPPWYISKSCSVAHDKKLVGYCMQAKSAFACTVVILYVPPPQFPLRASAILD